MEISDSYKIQFLVKKLHAIYGRSFRNLPSILALENQIGSSAFLIFYLYDHQDKKVSQSDLLERFSLTKGTISKTLSCLEKNGYVIRYKEKNDRRFSYLKITDQGKEFIGHVREEAKVLDDKILQGFNEEEVAEFISFLERAIENFSKED